ncbi:BZ3500_MvSof-1268-A1-R1_Chr5-2g07946 [Microbotryum saponariae]|uniref:BZ3500_MvSof-1268-A1-R1_Chr5-2g07946 protein n=1 Tax=Microbotryum saponariae TaxID=289078 RepID=A0A2X0KL72_9BASI|nr:BZ3500_MvSof-1268-A1-R1_Chr5-2g07946 [Microbotryum saponariae]SDA05815.1 BZ3501_MvSof-1269-A2-R1_Chr5-2g07768 [Microbotryum saponariae]
MSMSSATLRTSLHSLARQWPKDPLRPTLQFSDSLQAAVDRVFATPTPAAELGQKQILKAQEMHDSLTRLLANDALKSAPPHLTDSNFLALLLTRQYPMTQKTLQPASFPKHYARMQDGIARASRGEVVKGQSWLEWFKWK